MLRRGWPQGLLLLGLVGAPLAFSLPRGQDLPVDLGLGGGALVVPADRAAALQTIRSIPAGRTQHVLVRLDGTLASSERARLADSGLRLLQYIDRGTWFAAASGGVELPDEVTDRIEASWPIRSADRLDPLLAYAMQAPGALEPGVTVDVELLVFADVAPEEIRFEVEQLGGEVLAALPELEVVTARVPLRSLYSLSLVDGLHWIAQHPGRPVGEMDRARAYLNADGLPSAPYGLTGDGVEVSVHDYGHAFQHNDLSTRWVQGDLSAGQPLGVEQHPSMTGGTIAGDGTQNPLYRGFAPGATLVTYSYVSDPCCEANNFADIVLALQRGVDVANNSWGYSCGDLPYGDYTLQARVFDRETLGRGSDGTAVGDGIVVVFSGGNERDGSSGGSTACISDTAPPFLNYSTVNQPKPAKNVIVVGAVDSANDRMSSFSSWGPVSDGRLRPDVVAAGLHNGTLDSGISILDNPFGSPFGASNQQAYRTTDLINGGSFGGYAWFSQTSAAAAMVSGGSALLIEDFRDLEGGSDPYVSTVKALLIHTARDLDDSTSWYNPGPDYASGYGVVDMQAAVDQLRSGGWLEGCLDDGETDSLCMDVPAGVTGVKVTLVWSDEPASPATTSPALINDLDLVVYDPGGGRHYPWTLDPGSPSADAVRTQEDHLNNVEVVQVDSGVTAGTWTVEIVGTNVPMGPQCYSLVLTPETAGGEVDVECLGLVEVDAPADTCSAFVTVTASASGGCGAVVVENDFNAGGADASGDYPVGDTLVTFTATDASGNVDSCSTLVRVHDVTPPQIVCPPDVNVECDGSGNMAELTAWLALASASDSCGLASFVDDYTGLSDGCGATGTVTVTWTATDAAGNSASCGGRFTVLDTVPPTLDCPDDAVVTSGDSTAPDATGSASALDGCDGAPVVTYSDSSRPGAGPTDPVQEVITRRWQATDECGNTSSCEQTITVMKLELELDIKPGSCPNAFNRRLRGVLPVALVGTADFDPSTADLATLVIGRADGVGGLVPILSGPTGPHAVLDDTATPFTGSGCDCHALEGDGLLDLMLFFGGPEVGLQLPGFERGDTVELVVGGILLDGREFVAYDCVRIAN